MMEHAAVVGGDLKHGGSGFCFHLPTSESLTEKSLYMKIYIYENGWIDLANFGLECSCSGSAGKV